MKASDYIAEYIEHRGVTAVFELVGGMITILLDSIHQRGTTRIVSMHHEQSAAFAADAAGRLTGVPGVAFATSGPGATNLLTGIGSCYFDSSPAVFITGQVNRSELRGDRAIRQLGFQETDIVSMARPITKAAFLVTNPDDLPSILQQAFDLAVSGRPGPVLIDIPMDVQRADIQPSLPPVADAARVTLREPELLSDLRELLAKAKRPLVIAGGGIRSSGSIAEFQSFVRSLGLPVVYSLNGVDVLPSSDPLRVGMLGSYGNRWANLAIGESDLLIVLGSRLDIRQTGADTAAFKGEREIVHVDCEPGEINNRIPGCMGIQANLKDFFYEAEADGLTSLPTDYSSWLSRIGDLRSQWPDTEEIRDVPGINPNYAVHEVCRAFPQAGTFVTDVGQHQMWAAQSVELTEGQRFLSSGGMGSMGFGLPAAIGAAIATGQTSVVFAGDGGFQCNIQELQTVVRNNLPVKMVILNNGCHGMVRQFQESYFEGRYQSTVWGYDAPDFSAVAAAYGLASRRVAETDDLAQAVDWFSADPNRPALLEVMIDQGANAYPKIAFGRPMTEMEPYALPIEMEST